MNAVPPGHKERAIDHLVEIAKRLSSKKISEILRFDGEFYSLPPTSVLPPDFLDRETGKFFIMASLWFVSWIIGCVAVDPENDRVEFDEAKAREKGSKMLAREPEAWVMVDRNTGLFLNAVSKPGGLEYLMGLILSKMEETGNKKCLEAGDFYARITSQIFEAGEKHRASRKVN